MGDRRGGGLYRRRSDVSRTGVGVRRRSRLGVTRVTAAGAVGSAGSGVAGDGGFNRSRGPVTPTASSWRRVSAGHPGAQVAASAAAAGVVVALNEAGESHIKSWVPRGGAARARQAPSLRATAEADRVQWRGCL